MFRLLGDERFEDDLEFRVFRHIPEPKLVKHKHKFIELVYIESGEGFHEINGRKFKIAPGYIFVVEPKETHFYPDSVNLKIINILIKQSFLKKEAPNLKKIDGFWDFFLMEPFFRKKIKFNHTLKLGPEQVKEIENMILEMESEFREKEYGYKILAKGKLLEFIIKLCRFYTNYKKKVRFNTGLSRKRDAFFDVLGFISKNYSKKISIKDLAGIMHLRDDYFCKVFKNITRQTPIGYLMNYRVEQACKYLVGTDMEIKNIVFKVGFNDISYFIKVFKKINGITPFRFRKKHSKHTPLLQNNYMFS